MGPGAVVGRRFFFFFFFSFLAGSIANAQLVVSEIHYNPKEPGGQALEFVEIENPGAGSVDLAAWRISGAIEFTFPDAPGLGTIASGEHAVVVRDEVSFREYFPDVALVFGDWVGALDNAGEELVLIDPFGAPIDAVRYGDRLPWPEFADGGGASLQRLCASERSDLPENWVGAPVDLPSPGAPTERAVCPIEPPPLPDVVFSEIHYHPFEDLDDFEEFVELYNRGDVPVDLGGWSFADGIDFVFRAGTVLAPGAYLAVCRDLDAFRETYGTEVSAVGNFGGKLSNLGERLSIIDAEKHLVDAIEYADQGDWSFAADGLGSSLERTVFDLPSFDPAAWSHGRLPASGFIPVSTSAAVQDLVVQQLILLIDGEGEFIIDDVRLEAEDDPTGTNLVRNGDFEAPELAPWEARGQASGSRVEDGIGVEGSRALRLISAGPCGISCGSLNAVRLRFDRGALDPTKRYRLSLQFQHESGSSAISARVLQGVRIRFSSLASTPGRPNSVARTIGAPFVSRVSHHPQEPRSTDTVSIHARIRALDETPIHVSLSYERYRPDAPDVRTVPMFDDGLHQDGPAGDGVWSAELPPQPTGARVHYRIRVQREGVEEVVISPLSQDPGNLQAHEVWGYYVSEPAPTNDLRIGLPNYHLFVDDARAEVPTSINGVLDCSFLDPIDFGYEGTLYPRIGARFRGNTACYLKKRNFKLKFNRGRDFKGVRKLNLQGLWTDKSMLREHVAWVFMNEIGALAFETEFTRVNLNGQFHGLFLRLEHPDQRWLRRIGGLDPDGCLYKAKQPPNNGLQPTGVSLQGSVVEYERFWERETCETKDFGPLSAFIGELHSAAGLTPEFHEERTFVDWTIAYQLSQIVLDNIDSFAKNHFLYEDPSTNRWALVGWDMDLVFGKFFNFAVVDNFPDGERPVGTLNDCMLSDLQGDLNPWFTTRVNDNTILHHMVDRLFAARGRYYQRAYLVRLWNMLQDKHTRANLDPILDRYADRLTSVVNDDAARWSRYRSNPDCPVPPDMLSNISIVKRQISLHRDFLLSYVQAFHPAVMTSPLFHFTEILYDSEGGESDLEFVELVNHSGFDVDITGWRIGGGVDYVFPEGSRVADGAYIVVAKDLAAFERRYPSVASSVTVFGPFAGRLDDSGEALELYDAGPDWPAIIDRVHFAANPAWPVVREGFSVELSGTARDRDNDPGENWRVSAAQGGSPGGDSLPSFLRGDVDGSGSTNLTDAIAALSFLFLGGAAPGCSDAADVDDDGTITITDPIQLLGYLFLGGDSPRPPFPEPGVDPTGDDLACSALRGMTL
jgi:hypothetical protein